MTRERRHSSPGTGKYYPNNHCGGVLRRLYARNDTGGKTRYERTDYFFCTRCEKVVSKDAPDPEA